MIALSYGDDKNILTLYDAQKYETYARLNFLSKKERFEALHYMTTQDDSTPDEVKALGIFIESINSPLEARGSKKVFGNVSTSSEGLGYYVQASSTATSSGAINNYNLGTSKFQANPAGINEMLASCMNNPRLADNVGERCEIGLAMILAYLNPSGEYVALKGSEAGADVKKVGSNIVYELKYSTTRNDINTMYSASPPTVSKINKYYVFLTDHRGYLVSSPLLARLAVISKEIPEDFSEETIKAYEKDLYYYIGEVPEFFDKLYTATEADKFNQPIPELIELMNSVINNINQSKIAIDTCVKIIGINDLQVTTAGSRVSDKGNIASSQKTLQAAYDKALSEAAEDFLDASGNIIAYELFFFYKIIINKFLIFL